MISGSKDFQHWTEKNRRTWSEDGVGGLRTEVSTTNVLLLTLALLLSPPKLHLKITMGLKEIKTGYL